MILLLKELFSFKATVDISIVAVGLFFLYHTLLRQGTWKIVTGIVLAMILFFIADLLDLRGIKWIYSNLSPVAVIALIVIFQPELRKVFERAASMRSGKPVAVDDALTRTISEALFKLAEQRQGAIIVLPGNEPVKAWLAGGFVLDALPSFPLLMSIFDPNSPGHDGALIIDSGRLAQFGVRLPISESNKLPAELGTRHHAAMGLAEKTDALVLAVSEERGAVSCFKDGAYTAAANREAVVKAIQRHWPKTALFPFVHTRGPSSRPVTLRAMISVALAVVFWSFLTIAQRETFEKVVTLPVDFDPLPANLTVLGEAQKDIRVHLAGDKSALGEVSPSAMKAVIDLSKAGAGKQTLLITEENIPLPKGIRVIEIFPSNIELTLAAIVEKSLTVKPQLIGLLPGKRQLLSVAVEPKNVTALVPAAENETTLDSVTTTPIYLESVTEDTKILCKIIAPPSIQPTDKRWPDVEVWLRLGGSE